FVVDLELGREPAVTTLVAVTIGSDPRISLREAFHGELGEPDPRRVDLGTLTNVQPEPADRERVGRRREPEIDIDTALQLGNVDVRRAPSAIRGVEGPAGLIPASCTHPPSPSRAAPCLHIAS